MMNLPELHAALKATGYPVAYSHFKKSDVQPLPNPPFICYIAPDSDNFFADNVTYQEITNVDLELYTVKKDLIVEGQIKTLLNSLELPFEKSTIYIDSEKLYKTTYEVSL